MPGNRRRVPGLGIDDVDDEEAPRAAFHSPPSRPARPGSTERPVNLGEMATRIAAQDATIERLDRIASALVEDLDRVSSMVGQAMRTVRPRMAEQSDEPWCCRKCSALIGFYDRETEIMRVRAKLMTIRGRAGVGGFLAVDCRSCGEVNTIEHVAGDGEGIAVRGGTTILDVPTLEALLAKARDNGGVVELQIVEQPLGVPPSDADVPTTVPASEPAAI